LQYFIESFERYLPDRKACSFLYLAIHGKFWLSPEFTGLNVSASYQMTHAKSVRRITSESLTVVESCLTYV
jgi:hypothetical protein